MALEEGGGGKGFYHTEKEQSVFVAVLRPKQFGSISGCTEFQNTFNQSVEILRL